MSKEPRKGFCKLCQAKTADKTGSHIIPHLILRNVDNEAGTISRDKELGFRIGDSGVETYFGRSIQPEKIKEILGDYKIDELKNSEFIVDYLFCRSCEDFFSAIESRYSDSNVNSSQNPEVNFLFWTSIFWRASLIELGGFKLTRAHEKVIHGIINSNRQLLGTDQASDEICYRIVKCKDVPHKFPSGIFFHPIHTMPYMAVVGEFVLQLFVKKSYLNTVEKLFFGFETTLRNANLSTVKTFYGVDSISLSNYKDGMDQILIWLHERQDLNWKYKLDNVFVLLGLGGEMPKVLKQEILFKIHNSKLPLGRKYEINQVGKIIYSVLEKHGLIK